MNKLEPNFFGLFAPTSHSVQVSYVYWHDWDCGTGNGECVQDHYAEQLFER